MSTGNFKVLRASAGSGKTYALVREYLLIALDSDDSHEFRGILAITFTNAAAAEMKERVLLRLREFSKNGHQSDLATEICDRLGIEPLRLQVRAESCYRRMLHNYSQVGIMTIDKFILRILKAFARELRLSYDFSVEVDSARLLEDVIQRFMDLIGVDDEITEYAENLAVENLEEGGRWDFRSSILEKAHLITQEDTRIALQKLGEKNRNDFLSARKKIGDLLKVTARQAEEIQEKTQAIIGSAGFSLDELSYKGKPYITYMQNLPQNWADCIAWGPRFAEFAANETWLPKGKKSVDKEAVERFRQIIQPLMEEVMVLISPEKLANAKMLKAISKSLPALGLLKDLQALAEVIKQEDNYRLVSDFHQIIHDEIQGLETPYLYERIGVRYRHILIDEFQDTSELQWKNMLPLVVNSLSENNKALLVGDAKQSIYRWRGARVDQFVRLPEIHGIKGFSPDVLRNHFTEEILPKNFRSAKNIIQFNNTLYSELSHALGEYQIVYKDIRQENSRDSEGYVRIEYVDIKDRETRKEETLAKISTIVRECLNSGFRPCDIAILTRRGKKEASVIANSLLKEGYHVVTEASTLIAHSPGARALMKWLEFTLHPESAAVVTQLLHDLREVHPQLPADKFIEENTDAIRRKQMLPLTSFLSRELNADFSEWTFDQPVYMAAEFIRKARIPMDNALEYLVQSIRERTIDKQNSLAELISWWQDKKDNLYTSAIADENSIRILTIHKSKGLQYPVVIYPRFSTSENSSDIWINLDPDICGLNTARVPWNTAGGDLSFAGEEILKEKSRNMLDQTNVAYVATTRAEERLYMIVEQGDSTAQGIIFMQTLQMHFPPDPVSGRYTLGEEKSFSPSGKPLLSETPAVSIGQGNPAKLKLIAGGIQESSQRAYGEFLHACLAEIRDVKKIRETIARIQTSQHYPDIQPEKVLQDIERILSHEEVAKWFQDAEKVFVEQECALQDGSVIRPDRIAEMHDHIAIIDYKSGDPHPSQEDQVRHYMRSLEPLFSKKIRGFLVFTTPGAVREVAL